MARIKVRLEFERFAGEYDAEVWRDIDDLYIVELIEPIDTPTNLGAIMFCTPQEKRTRISMSRKNFASLLSRELSASIVNILGKRDMFDGYKKEEGDEQ